MFGRNDAWWRSAIFDPAEHRHGASPLRCLLAEDASGPRALCPYAAVDTWTGFLPENVLTVHELMAADPAASAALCTDLLSRDLTTEFRLASSGRRPAALPAVRTAPDQAETERQPVGADRGPAPRAGRPTGTPARWTWSWRFGTSLPADAGRWRLSTTTEGTRGRPGRFVRPGQLAGRPGAGRDPARRGLPGRHRLGALAGSGLVTELRPGATRPLSAA